MKLFSSLVVGAAFLALFAVPTLPAQAAKGEVTVLHGIPGLPADVDVFANNSKLFSFGFGEQRGPLSLDPGNYFLEVKLNGTPVLSANATVAAGKSYSVIANLNEMGKPAINLYENKIDTLAANQSRLTVRHTAAAPAVDVRLFKLNQEIAKIPALANPKEFTADVPSASYFALIYPAGSPNPVFGPVPLNLQDGISYTVYAVGDLTGNSFTLLVQTIDLTGTRGMLTTMVAGKSCGGTIGVDRANPTLGARFKVTLSGATANGHAILFVGTSNSSILGANLPLALDVIGAPGCTFYTNAVIISPQAVDSRGNSEFEVTLPLEARGLMSPIYFQYGYIAPAANAVGLLFTDYLSVMEK